MNRNWEDSRRGAKAQRWTRESPTKPGLYWYHQKDGTTESIELDYNSVRDQEELCSETVMSVPEMESAWEIDAWCGPIVAPDFDLTTEDTESTEDGNRRCKE